MRSGGSATPQSTLLYRAVALVTRFQLGSMLRHVTSPRLAVGGFVLLAGVTSLGIITTAAYITSLPLLFPPLGPSAFTLFSTPMAERSSPRNVILSHTLALVLGLGSLHLADRLFPGTGVLDPGTVGWTRVLAISLAMGTVSAMMIALRCNHAPAVATALLAAMGFFRDPVQVLGLPVAVLLLVAAAFLFIRVLGGIPYPLWRSDPAVSREYGVLAGIPAEGESYLRQLSSRIIRECRR